MWLIVLRHVIVQGDHKAVPGGVKGIQLLQTCNTIYNEASPILWNSTAFRLDFEDGNMRKDNSIIALDFGPAKELTFLRRIQKMTLNIHAWWPSKAKTLSRRIEAVLEVMEYCRHVKKLRIEFSTIDYRYRDACLEIICKAVERINCNGNVAVLQQYEFALCTRDLPAGRLAQLASNLEA